MLTTVGRERVHMQTESQIWIGEKVDFLQRQYSIFDSSVIQTLFIISIRLLYI